jgi:hypothetical protein
MEFSKKVLRKNGQVHSSLYRLDRVNKSELPEPLTDSAQNYRLTSCLLEKYLVKVSIFASESNPRITANDLRDGKENTIFYYPLIDLPIGKGVVT